MRSLFVFCLLCLPVTSLLSAERPSDRMVDSQGYPLDDPEYDEIRNWHDQEKRGLALFRKKDYARAYKTLAEPARHGFKRAQHSLALMHINGNGVDKNILVGIALLGLAAESGDRKLEREYDKAVKALPEKYQQPVRDQTQYYIARYGMDVQGITCSSVKRYQSNLKDMLCLKIPGEYRTWEWAP